MKFNFSLKGRQPADTRYAFIKAEVPDAVVGLGTVLTTHDLELVAELDLPFAFSPGATPASRM